MSSTQPKIFGVGKVQIGGETTFATASTSLDDVQVLSVDRSGLDRPVIEDLSQRQGLYQKAPIAGLQRGSITLTGYLHGYSSTVPVAAPAHTTGDQAGATGFDQILGLFAGALGDLVSGGYEASALTYAAKAVTMTDASSFVSGQAVAWATAATPAYEVGWLTDRNGTTTVTLFHTPEVDPQTAGAAVLYGSHTLYVDDGEIGYLDGTPSSYTVKVFGHDADDATTCVGCRPQSFKLRFPAGELPTWEMQLGVAAFSEAGSGGAPAKITWSYPSPEPVGDGTTRVIWGNNSGTHQRIVHNLEIDFGLTVNPIGDLNKPGGIGGWIQMEAKPKITFTVLRDVSVEVTDYGAETAKGFAIWTGSQPGKLLAVFAPNAHIVAFPSWQDGDGAMMAPITLQATCYTGDTDSQTDGAPADTRLRMAFL